jgi:CheY-like chemotaxis protein
MGAKPGSYVVLSITDTGIGMDKETARKVFEPFFTTKEEGKGTGLGLSMVYGVVKNHGGYIATYSEPGQGTTFKIYLPVKGAPEEEHAVPSKLMREGTELVLIVDDEEVMRSIAKDILEAHGYSVLLACDGIEAISVYKEFKEEINLVLLDMVMPKKGARETFLELKALNPSVKAILSTGYSRNGKAQEILDSGVIDFIQKPYQVDSLLAKVRGVLDAGTAS